MSTTQEKTDNDNDNDNDIRYYIKNINRIAIVHFNHIYRDNQNKIKQHPPLDYHIHFLTFVDIKHCYCGAILLDTNDVMTQPFIKEEDTFKQINEILIELSRDFIDKISVITNKENPQEFKDLLFTKSNQLLWDFFNTTKNETYLRDLTRFLKMENDTEKQKLNFLTEYNIPQKIQPDDEYKDVKISISESLFVTAK